jgi:hypothetical protein
MGGWSWGWGLSRGLEEEQFALHGVMFAGYDSNKQMKGKSGVVILTIKDASRIYMYTIY